MEESDQLLITSLHRLKFQIPEGLKTLSQIDSDLLVSIGIQFLQMTGVALSKALQSTQKFRRVTKLSEDLNKFSGLRVDVNSLMNPNVNDLRRVLVHLISKMSLAPEDDAQGKNDTIEERIVRQKQQLQRQIFRTWLREDWVHPCLIDQKNAQHFRTLETNVQLEGKSLRRNYIIQNFDAEIKSNMFASIARVIDLAEQRAAEQKKLQEDAYMAGEAHYKAKTAQKHAAQMEDFRSKNKHEMLLGKGNKQVKKIERNFTQVENPADQPVNDQKQTHTEDVNLFEKQLEYQAETSKESEQPVETADDGADAAGEDNGTGETGSEVPDEAGAKPEDDGEKSTTSTATTQAPASTEVQEPPQKKEAAAAAAAAAAESQKTAPPAVNPVAAAKKKMQKDLEALREKNRAEIAELNVQLTDLSKKMEKYETKKTTMEDQLTQKQEEVDNYKEANTELSKKVQQLSLLVKQLEVKDGNTALRNEIKAIQKDIDEIEQEWEQHKEKLVVEIDKVKDQSRKKYERLDQMRDKLQRLDGEIKQVVQDTRNGYDRKDKLIDEFKKMPKEGNREVYVKKIQQITQNFQKQQEDLKKIIEDVKSQDTQIDYQLASLDRYYIEFENSYNTDTKKNESLSKQIFKIYKEYREIFDGTVNNLRDLGRKKIEVRNLEVKLDILSAKGYKQGVEKVKHDLQEIKAENARLEKRQ